MSDKITAAGYAEDFSKSNNAHDAEMNGRFPASQLAPKLGVSAKFIKEHAPHSGEWHHTSKFYNSTSYYDRDQVKEWLDSDEGKQAKSEFDAKQKEAEKSGHKVMEGASIKHLEWSGTRNHPVAHEREEHGVHIHQKPGQQMVTITRGDGTQFKKKLDTRGFEIKDSKGKYFYADYVFKNESVAGTEHKGKGNWGHGGEGEKGGPGTGTHKASEKGFEMNKEVIHCRASGNTINVSKDWSLNEDVNFMWMPAGTHTITAGITRATAQGMVDKTVHMTVLCDQQTAETVQASFEEWLQERPKQKPYGCVEHREQEATVLAKGFEWRDGEEGGVYLAAEPTALGVQNVNGKIHRSWSPSFTTDAETNKAVEKNGVLMFPPGARGSAQNPARITGVDFVVGTLTNKPAFRNISPVKAREAAAAGVEDVEVIYSSHTGDPDAGVIIKTTDHANSDEVVTASGTSEGAKKGWTHRTQQAHEMTSSVDRLERSIGSTKDPEELKKLAVAHDEAGDAHNSAAYHAENSEDISGVQAEIVANRHAQLSAHHRFAARRIRELRERLSSGNTKASNNSREPNAIKSTIARKQAADELIKAAAARNKPEFVIPENETAEQILARLGKGITKTNLVR